MGSGSGSGAAAAVSVQSDVMYTVIPLWAALSVIVPEDGAVSVPAELTDLLELQELDEVNEAPDSSRTY